MQAADDGDGTTSLEARIVAAFGTLAQKQRRVAEVMLADPLGIAFRSAEDVGRRAGVHPATVVRFSRLLGYEGYAELRQAVQLSLPHVLTAAEKVARGLQSPDGSPDVSAGLYAQDLRNIEETARVNPPETIVAVVEALSTAPRVFVFGLGMEACIADNLARQLALIGISAHRLPGSLADAAVGFAPVEPGDVVVIIALFRYVRSSVAVVEAAAEAGATTIAITDSRLAPIALPANHTLIAATETVELSHSLTALMSLTTLLATRVALKNPHRALERLRRVDELFEAFDVLT